MKKITTALIAIGAATALMAAVNAGSCTGCHGSDWSKTAMGNKDVSKMTHQEISDALIGYKNGTYGAAKKAMMKGPVAKYSDAELTEFSKTVGVK